MKLTNFSLHSVPSADFHDKTWLERFLSKLDIWNGELYDNGIGLKNVKKYPPPPFKLGPFLTKYVKINTD